MVSQCIMGHECHVESSSGPLHSLKTTVQHLTPLNLRFLEASFRTSWK